jgi:hypothetical protein
MGAAPSILRRLAGTAACPLALALALTLAPAGVAPAQDRDLVLRGEFPVDLETPPTIAPFSGLIDPAYSPALPDGEAARALLEEARWVFGAMVWGFDYVYTPSDKARSIADLFELKPRSELAWGSPTFRVLSTRLEGTVVHAAVEWNLGPSARAEYQSWRGARFMSGQGRASVRLSAEPDSTLRAGDGGALPLPVAQRRDAMAEAAKEALRAYLRGIEYNKPREVRGSFALAEQPRLALRSGAWVATVRILISVDEVLGYGAY